MLEDVCICGHPKDLHNCQETNWCAWWLHCGCQKFQSQIEEIEGKTMQCTLCPWKSKEYYTDLPPVNVARDILLHFELYHPEVFPRRSPREYMWN